MLCFFFFSSRRRHTRLQGDWSSDVCSSDLGLSPASRQVFRNRASCVRGEQDATITRFRSWSRICCLIRSWVSFAQVYTLFSAYTTLSSVLTYSTTLGTSTTPAMLLPQWQTKTPIRGGCPLTSISGGYSLTVIREPLASLRSASTLAAAADACITVSGMSLGSVKGPAR